MRLQQLLGKFWIRVENLNAGPGINHILLLIKKRLESIHYRLGPRNRAEEAQRCIEVGGRRIAHARVGNPWR